MRVWIDRHYGQAGFLAFGWWGIIKSPWCPPLFTEKYGFQKFWSLGLGWRAKIRRIRQINTPDREG